jgi:hypothetical protein
MKQRALAGSAGPHDRDHFTPRDGQVDATEDTQDAAIAAAERLGDALGD